MLVIIGDISKNACFFEQMVGYCQILGIQNPMGSTSILLQPLGVWFFLSHGQDAGILSHYTAFKHDCRVRSDSGVVPKDADAADA
jgi:hypothetical protein